MAYATLSELKQYLGPLESTDDALLTQELASAQALIEEFTHKTFEVLADATRYFSVDRDVCGSRLDFGDWLCSVTTVTNGDGIVVAANEYRLFGRHSPYYAMELRPYSGKYWTYTNDPTDAISIVGKWGYSINVPYEIKQVTLRLAGWMYRQKDAQVFDQTAFTEIGTIRMKAAIPQDIISVLTPYMSLGNW